MKKAQELPAATGCCLAALMLLIGATSLSGPGWNGWSAALAELQAGATVAIHEPVLSTLLERLFTFGPLGFLIRRELARRGSCRPTFAACIASLLCAMAIELAQAPVAGRHARLSDLLLAAAFGTVGSLISDWLGAPLATARLRALLLGLLVLGNAIIGGAIVHSHLAAELRGWDCSYPLLVANERTGDRPWLGRIRDFSIYDHVPAAVSLAAFDFGRVEDGRIPSNSQADLLLPPATDASWQVRDGALAVVRPLIVKSTTGSRQLCEAIMSSGAFALEATIASASDQQQGPARIVSQSTDPMARNFTLAQEGSALVLRVRTPWTGSNGALHSTWIADALPDSDWHRVSATYVDGVATLAVDGVRRKSTRYYELLAVSERLVVPLAIFALAGFVGMGLILAWLFEHTSWPRRLVYAWLGAAFIPVSAALLLSWQLGHGPDWPLFTAAGGGPVIGMLALTGWSRVREAARSRPAAPVAEIAARDRRLPLPVPCARPPARQ